MSVVEVFYDVFIANLHHGTVLLHYKLEYLKSFPNDCEIVDIPHNVKDLPYNYFDEKCYQRVVTYLKEFDVVFPIFIVASFLATEYMRSLGNNTMKQWLGVMLIFIALYFIFSEGKIGRIFKSKLAQVAIGSISGVMGGMFAMPGPPLVLYCISTIEDKREYVTTLQAFSVVINLFYTLFRFKAGFYSEDTWLWWLVGLGGAVIGSFIGSRFFEQISNRTLKYIVYVMMIVSGMVAIL